MGHKTALYSEHEAAGAKIVDFGGWDMPLHYGSQVDEHHIVRQSAGMFDVSHMTIVDIAGDDAMAFLQYLLANDVAKLQTIGRALYAVMLNEQGCVIDDLIVYKTIEGYRLVVNCSTREKDLAWMTLQAAQFSVALTERDELSMIAVQGPQAMAALAHVLPAELYQAVNALKPFNAATMNEWMVGRTGYTGEDGVEIMLPAAEAKAVWEKCLAADVKPIGLGARDTLRLEAGMNLYGNEMDETIQPWDAGLAWTLALQDSRNFIGRTALEATQAAGIKQKLVGIVLEGKGVLRSHQAIRAVGSDIAQGAVVLGEITSGTFSPTIKKGIAMARVSVDIIDACEVEMRGKWLPANVVKMPFVRNGEIKC